jgi:CspA family cold shock protein
MAESFQKKESIKKNALRKKVKAGKKLDRKTNNNKGKGLDAMISYVDAYGRPTSIPPEPRTPQGTPESYRS